MIQVTGIIKALDSNKYYLILNSDVMQMACEVKGGVAEELLQVHAYAIVEIDSKTNTQEFTFES